MCPVRQKLIDSGRRITMPHPNVRPLEDTFILQKERHGYEHVAGAAAEHLQEPIGCAMATHKASDHNIRIYDQSHHIEYDMTYLQAISTENQQSDVATEYSGKDVNRGNSSVT